jgi:hypothetical protein
MQPPCRPSKKSLFWENAAMKPRQDNRIKKREKKCPRCEIAKPVEKFVTVYGFPNPRGKYCRSCFLNHQRAHAISLMEGRDFCLYCGNKVEKVYDWTPVGKSAREYLQLDHMDPISQGGDDTEQNTVYCCVTCNQKKRDKLFTVWLEELKPEYRELSRKIYIEKHGREPEEFSASSSAIVLSIDLNAVLKKLVKPKR